VLLAVFLPCLPGDPPNAVKVPSVRHPSNTKRVGELPPLPLQSIKALKNKFGVTVNDVLVAVITGAIQRYLTLRGEDPKRLSRVRGLFPFNIRKKTNPDEPPEFGNKFTFLPMPFPIQLATPVERLMECKRLCDQLKRSPAPALLTGIQAVGRAVIPYSVMEKITIDMLDKFTLVFTNVMGPQEPVHFFDREILRLMFYVPAIVGTILSLISYNNTFTLGLTTDPQAITDPKDFLQCFSDEFQALQAAAASYEGHSRRTRLGKGAYLRFFFTASLLLAVLAAWVV